MSSNKGNGDTLCDNGGQERPVVFQKYFKTGHRTYASQIKLGTNGKKYMVITEGVRDPESQEVKKHVLRVYEADLKEFFAMMQETVIYLRSTKGTTPAAARAAARSAPQTKPAVIPAPPKAPAKTASPRNGNTKPVSTPVASPKVTRPGYRAPTRSR